MALFPQENIQRQGRKFSLGFKPRLLRLISRESVSPLHGASFRSELAIMPRRLEQNRGIHLPAKQLERELVIWHYICLMPYFEEHYACYRGTFMNLG